jgi:hypothetical protein
MDTVAVTVPAAPVTAVRQVPQAPHERDTQRMFFAAGLPTRWRLPPLLAWLSSGIGAFSLLWNPNYYILQPAFWSAHIMIMAVVYPYLWRIRKSFHTYTGQSIPRAYRWITLAFYWLFMAYWAYFCYLELSAHPEDSWLDQIGNVFMSWVWYIFFATASAVYYYTATLLLQRAAALKTHIAAITAATTKAEFFAVYDDEYERNRRLGNTWNLIMFLVILILVINIPADLLGILVNKTYVAAPGLVMKSLGLIWYLLCICKLNYMEDAVLNHLHKHHVLQDDCEEIVRYMEVRRLGLNFFGLRITYGLLAKVAMIGFNVILPMLYGLVSTHILQI